MTLETSARLLRLLSLLQARPDRSGPELAERLGVTSRTIRNDVQRLRRLGYPVHATPGVAGGYRVRALHASTVEIGSAGPRVDAELLAAIAAACRDHQGLRFDYRDHDGSASLRSVEPHRMVHDRGRWYLVAWDSDRRDWRTFRADRIRLRTPGGPRFAPRDPPGGDVATYLQRGVGSATWRYRARVRVHAPAELIAARVPPAVLVEAVDERTCIVDVGSDDPGMLALYLGMLDADFEVGDSPELVERLGVLADRYRRAIAGTGRGDPATLAGSS